MSDAAKYSAQSFLAVRDGRALANAMLHELIEAGADAYSLQARFREPGVSQNNVVLRYLQALRKHKNRAVETGFAEVVTDVLALSLDGEEPNAYDEEVDDGTA